MSIEYFLEPNQDAPGQWCESDENPAFRNWKGRTMWSTRHGEAICEWLLGEPHRVRNAVLPDGSRIDAKNMDRLSKRRWRRKGDNGNWLYGDVVISNDDIQFVQDDIQPSPQEPEQRDVPDMNLDMFRSMDIKNLVKDDSFAKELYAAMCNQEWRKDGSKERWGCSWRSSGGIVADLRGIGEIYVDFYCSGNEGVVSERVKQELHKLGWHPMTEDEIEEDHQEAVRKIMKAISRKASSTPEWYADLLKFRHQPDENIKDDLREPTSWPDVIHWLGVTGRISIDEWHEVWSKIDCIHKRMPDKYLPPDTDQDSDDTESDTEES